jgi:photosystem II stability/assembly factor-like uncharacterized protein
MKRCTLLRALQCALLVPLFALAQGWSWQNPYPQGNDLYDVTQFWTDYGGTGWFVGASGTLIETNNADFYQRADLGNGSLMAVSMTDRDHAWITSSSQSASIYFTSNRGQTWIEQFRDSSLFASDIQMLNNQLGWATANGPWHSFATVMRTTDGGTTWAKQLLDSSAGLDAVSFVDARHGWVAGYGNLLARTTDGGLTWEKLASPAYEMQGMEFTDSLNGYFLGIVQIYMTHDGGQTWHPSGARNRTWLMHAEFVGTQLGWVTGNDGLMLHTTDGGETWAEQTTGTHEQINSVHFYTYPYGQAVGNGGVILYTYDGGQHWNVQSHNPAEGAALYRASFSRAGTGWAINNGNVILHTTDGGIHWTNQTTAWSLAFRDIAAVSAESAFLVGDGGGIFLTTDGGQHWLPQYSGTSYPLERVRFVNNLVGWVGSGSNELLHTTDGGIHWTMQHDEYSHYLLDMTFVDENTGWMVDGGYPWSGQIRRTTDGGITWESQFISADTVFFSCSFPDAQNGWCGGLWCPDPEGQGYAVLLHTTDGGLTWLPQTVGDTETEEVDDVVFTDAQNGWALTEDGIFVTNNGGENWYHQETPATQRLYALAANGPHSMWAVGGNGAILHWTGTNAVNPPHVFIPQKLTLTAYPNPFNPRTTITYTLPQSGRVTLDVFDITGRLTARLQDGLITAGEHAITFDGSALASGIYFARMQVGSTTQTMRMILLK